MIITAQLRNSGSVSPAPVAHSEEQRTFNPRVLGSKPSGGTTQPSDATHDAINDAAEHAIDHEPAEGVI